MSGDVMPRAPSAWLSWLQLVAPLWPSGEVAGWDALSSHPVLRRVRAPCRLGNLASPFLLSFGFENDLDSPCRKADLSWEMGRGRTGGRGTGRGLFWVGYSLNSNIQLTRMVFSILLRPLKLYRKMICKFIAFLNKSCNII